MLFSRRSFLLILSSVLALTSFTAARAVEPKDDSWKSVAANDLAEVSVQKSLYEKPESQRFFVRVRIHNKANKEIGFDVKKSSSVFYVNQFVENDSPTREAVDEMRMMPQALSSEQKDRLNAMFADNGSETFVHVAPGKDFEYFVAFLGPEDSFSQLRKSNAKYAILVVDGHMHVTDGTNVQRLERGSSDTAGGEVPVSLPPHWLKIPAGAKVIDKSS